VDDTPPTSDSEFWEPGALELIGLLKEKGGAMSLRAVKTAMRFKGYKIHVTVNLLSYLDLSGRVKYSREEKVWRLTEKGME